MTSAIASDVTTTLGTRSNAQEGWDALDSSEPPTLGQTVAAYFDHSAWGAESGLYNTDYQAPLQVGESRTWRLTAFRDRSDMSMQFSWEKTIGHTLADTMLYFRREGETEWRDMRQVRFVDLPAESPFIEVKFEVRAEQFAMSSIADLIAVAGEKQVTLHWRADDNPFIKGYTIHRQKADASARFTFHVSRSSFIDTDVEEDATYTYQVTLRFKSGAELKSDLNT